MLKSFIKLNYDFTQKRIYFNAWKDYVFAKNDFMISIKAFEDQVLKRKLAEFYLKWVYRASRHKVEREMLEKAQRFGKHILSLTYFGKYLAIFRRKRIETMKRDEKMRLMKLELDKRK